ncbi:hypothetical protein Pfo_003262 [Paulownia fortunei]|nr:hypothetical protein Pfo_003262 [Paulownia fortunei]
MKLSKEFENGGYTIRPRPVRIPNTNPERHVFISGGSSSIDLTRHGADVTLLARDATQHSIKLATGQDVSIFRDDVREYGAVERVMEEGGPIEVLLCNHGVYVPQELEEVTFIIDVNLMCTFHLIKAALRGTKRIRAGRGTGSIAILSLQAGQGTMFSFRLVFMVIQLTQLVNLVSRVWRRHYPGIKIRLLSSPCIQRTENKRRPQLINVITSSSCAMKADEGILLSAATAGLSPQRSYLMAFVEVVAAGLLLIAGLCFQWNWYRSIKKWHAQRQ